MTDFDMESTCTAVVPYRRPGRPSTYSSDRAAEICKRLIDGESLRSICDDEHMPDKMTVFRWLETFPEFATSYARARELQAEVQFDDMTDIANDGRNDWMEARNKNGEIIGYRLNGEAVARSKLRAEVTMWRLERLKPKKYGKPSPLAGEDGDTLHLLATEVRRAIAQRLAAALRIEPKPDDAGSGA